ncbi:MAG TPA: chain-length determining protein [Deltaproteobacteria bacterium]|nr:chain-length determining protein [Deltaproteobacteria bacterium]
MNRPSLTFGDLVIIARRRFWSLVLPFSVVITGTVIVAVTLPPVYRSSSTILIEQQDIPEEFVKTTISTYAEHQLQIIKKRIMSSKRLIEIIGRFNLYSEMRNKVPSEEIVERMRKDIKLESVNADVMDPRTGRPMTATIAFTLSYEGNNRPQTIYEVATVLASLFLEENIKAREQHASEVARFLEEELANLRADLMNIDARITAFKKKHINDLPDLVQVNMQSVREAERNIDMLSNQLSQLRMKEGSLKAQLANISPDSNQADVKRPDDLYVQLVDLRQRFSEEYPDIVKTKAEIAELERQIKRPSAASGGARKRAGNPTYIALFSELTSVQAEMRSVKGQISDMKQRMLEYKSSIGASAQVESEYKTLMAERAGKQGKYDDLMRKLMEARVSQGLEKEKKGERFTLIDPAQLPEKPYKPNRLAIMLLGFILSVSAGIGTVALKEITDASVRGVDMLSSLSSIPVLASIPKIPSGRKIYYLNPGGLPYRFALMKAGIASIIIPPFIGVDKEVFRKRMLRRMGIYYRRG